MKTDVKYSNKTISEAYHGTSQESAIKINDEKKINPSRDDDFYLGDGIYFYEYSKWLAAQWAMRKYGKHSNIGILCACINYGYCLNLDVPEHREVIRRVQERIVKRNTELKITDKITDSYVINYYTKNIACYIDTVRWTYITRGYGTIFTGSQINDYQQPMICVKKDSNISKISLEYVGVGYHA